MPRMFRVTNKDTQTTFNHLNLVSIDDADYAFLGWDGAIKDKRLKMTF